MLFKAFAANHQVYSLYSFHEELLVFHSVNIDRDLPI